MSPPFGSESKRGVLGCDCLSTKTLPGQGENISYCRIMLKVKLDFFVGFPTHFKKDKKKMREREKELRAPASKRESRCAGTS